MSKYGIGERWYCDRSVGGNPYNRPPFTFVIVGQGDRPGHKKCQIETCGYLETPIHEYSHKHLNKYAVHVQKEAK
jgi:hypothetical protein